MIRIYGRRLSRAEIDKLKELLIAAGALQEEILVVDEIGEPNEACGDEVILILLTPAVCADAVVEAELSKAPLGGRRAICVWPSNAQNADVPVAAQKFSYSIVPWSADRLRVALADDDVTCFETPTGEPLPAPETDHLECP